MINSFDTLFEGPKDDKTIWKSDEEINKETKFYFDQIKKKPISRCLHPNLNECSGPPIKSHSIQLLKILKNICDKTNHVIYFKLKPTQEKFIVDLSYTGIKEATIFPGLCKYHDTNTFKLIENSYYDIDNIEYSFLYAYRAFLRGYYVDFNNYLWLDLFIKEFYDTHESSPSNDFVFTILMKDLYKAFVKYFNLNKIKTIFDFCLINKEYKDYFIFNHKILDFELPIAVSSSYAPDFDFENKIINDYKQINIPPNYVYINIFPELGRTNILLTYLIRQRKNLDNYINHIIKTHDITNVLSETILKYIENFVLSPDHWHSIDLKKRNKILEYFILTLHDKTVEYIPSNHNLFK